MKNEYTEFTETFSELKSGKPVLIAREATFIHRRGITKKDLQLIKDNFDNNVIGMQVDFDYDHKEDVSKGRKAAGWIKSIEFGEVEADGKKHAALFAIPEWTPEAQRSIKDGEYKYTSPELYWEWKHPESGKKYNSVLRSVAILNRPQIPGQPSILLSEAKITKEVFKVEKIKKLLEKNHAAKFAEEVTEDAIVEKFSEILQAKDEAVKAKEKEVEEAKVKFTELEKTKAEADAQIATFKEAAEKAAAEKYAADVVAIVEKAKEKLPPAVAEGMFKALAEKDLDAATKHLDSITSKFGDVKAEGLNDEGGVAKEIDEATGVAKMREAIAKERGVKLSEIDVREAYQAYDKKSKEVK